MLRIKTESAAENSIAVIFPAEELEKLGISAGDEVEVTKTGNALILRSIDEAERREKIQAATDKVFDRWDKVFTELAKGASDETEK
jgi:antitoxin component of MazEF toxin-antitoxin module